MAWEERNGHSYYYRKRRIGRRIVSEYMGAGLLAELAAERTENDQAEREAWQAQCAAEAAIDRRLAELCGRARALAHGHLLAAGYWQHKRQWRKRTHDRGDCNAD